MTDYCKLLHIKFVIFVIFFISCGQSSQKGDADEENDNCAPSLTKCGQFCVNTSIAFLNLRKFAMVWIIIFNWFQSI